MNASAPVRSAACRGPVAALVLPVLTALACSPSPEAAGAFVERSHLAMGSEVRVTASVADERAAAAAFQAVFAEFDRLDALMSIWRDGSEVRRLNAAAGRAPVPVSRELQEVLLAARQVGDWTGGKFDVTFGALSDVWRFDHDRDGRVPSSAEIRLRLPLVDYSAVRVDERAGTAFVEREGMQVHVGGLGKGYAIDRAAAILRERGVEDFMIQAGGDLYVAGRRGDRPWKIGIKDPRGPDDRSFAAIELSDAALSTSGDYERYFIRDGRRYHHILDPDTGQPADGARSVSIVAPSAMLSDALATGVFILGPVEGLGLLERLPAVEGAIVGADNSVTVSAGLRERLALLAPPTDAP